MKTLKDFESLIDSLFTVNVSNNFDYKFVLCSHSLSIVIKTQKSHSFLNDINHIKLKKSYNCLEVFNQNSILIINHEENHVFTY